MSWSGTANADVYLRLVVGVVVLLGVAFAALTFGGVLQRRAVLTASLRAAAQLAVVALALRGVFAYPAAAFLVVVLMYTVATATAARRLAGLEKPLRKVAAACALGAGVVIAVIVLLPVLSRDVRTLVAVSGIVLGGCMSAATLTGRRLREGLRRRREEIEGWLALGATMREALRPIVRDSCAEALVPGLDQTRTVGLVTLPGAFVGALLGGAGAIDAARFQLVVLVGLLCAQSITTVLLGWQLGVPTTLPE